MAELRAVSRLVRAVQHRWDMESAPGRSFGTWTYEQFETAFSNVRDLSPLGGRLTSAHRPRAVRL